MFSKGTTVLFITALVLNSYVNFIFASEVHRSSKEECNEHKEEELGKNTNNTYSIGGQIRLRGDFAKNQNLADFSLNPDTGDEQLVSRSRLNFSLQPIEQIKGFFQGQFYARRNQRDYSKMNLYQAYLELSDLESLPIGLKLGRQDFCYGSAFFLGSSDFYDGLAWDGAKLRVVPLDNVWIDIIGVRYVSLDKHKSYDKPALYGLYSSYRLTEDADTDLYFFYHKGGFKFFHADLPDSQRWFTFGARIAGKIKEQFDYEIEPLYQFGKIDNPARAAVDIIAAYGGHAEAGYKFKTKFNPRLFAAYAFGSGDNSASDKKYQEFHGNIYNDNYLVGDTSLIPDLSGITVGGSRASGMHILVTGISTDINPKLNFNLDYHYFLADRLPFGVSRNIGSEANLIATYKLLENTSFSASFNRFFTERFFKDASGSSKDIDYFYLQTQIEF